MVAPFVPLALAMVAQTAAPTAATAAATPTHEPRCGVPTGENAIIICAPRPQGYRIDPDVLAAKRGSMADSGAPRPNNPTLRPDCATVGPAPCVTAGVNLLGAALTAVQMAQRLAAGKEIGSMFKTDPTPSEYQRYQRAKASREAEEAEKAAEAVKAKALAAQSASVQQ